jgi:tRNA1Val (adenine37-N6)-methyltransferase
MANVFFRFKQFEVYHNRCAMKVGTDGVLLGAWVETGSAQRILDVGTGSGLIALILAQHSIARVDGVEFDKEAASQAAENISNSLWSDRMQIIESDFSNFSNGLYDLIVSNPPYFRKSLKAPVKERNQARHTDTLSYETLVRKSASMLMSEGRFAVVLPFDVADVFEDMCWQQKLYTSKRCEVSSIEGQAPKRVLLEFSRFRKTIERTFLALSTPDHQQSIAFSELTADLYLNR